MTDLARLIEKLSAASEGSRGLDAEIGDAVGLHNVHWDEDDCFYALDLDEDHGPWLPVPVYSKSLDAALSLVPEGCDWDVGHIQSNGYFSASVMTPQTSAQLKARFGEWSDGDGFVMEHGKAPAPALALCIASLKARQANDIR